MKGMTIMEDTNNNNEQQNITPNEPLAPVQENVEYSYTWDDSAKKAAEQVKQRKEARKLRIFAVTMSLLTVLSVSAMVLMLALGSPFQAPNNNGNSAVSENGVKDGSNIENTVSFPQFNAGIITDGEQLSLQEIAAKFDKSTVTVYCTSNDSWGGQSISFGSGFLISENGYIVTNHHVIENATLIKALFYDGTEFEAKLVGSDALYDLAVLKIEGEGFIPAELGDSNQLVVGDMVIAIGTPYSLELAGTHTFGFISATDRKVKVSSGASTVKTMTMLQTDATLNSGNSGGPLVNIKGQVIGINTMKLTANYEGIGFAIPMSNAIDIINQLIENGTVTDPNDYVTASPYLGVKVGDITESDSKLYEVPMGALVTFIETSGSAYKAGMRRNDIITEFAGEKVESVDDLLRALEKHKAGDTVAAKVYRNENTVTVNFKLDARKS